MYCIYLLGVGRFSKKLIILFTKIWNGPMYILLCKKQLSTHFSRYTTHYITYIDNNFNLQIIYQSVHSVLCVTLSNFQVLQSCIKMPSCLICFKNEIYAFRVKHFSMKSERHIWSCGLICLFPLLAMVRGRWLIEKKGRATKFTSN